MQKQTKLDLAARKHSYNAIYKKILKFCKVLSCQPIYIVFVVPLIALPPKIIEQYHY